jgi:hypothetical protein
LLAVVAGGKLLGFVGVVLAVPIAATTAVLVRYAVRYYEHTSFFGHESDADVVITPAMALIMPGVVPGARVIEASPDPDLGAGLELERSELDRTADDWMFDSELPLGPSGSHRSAAAAAASATAVPAAPASPATPEDKPEDKPKDTPKDTPKDIP